MTRTKRSIANFLSLLVLQATTIAIGLFSTPLLLQWLGDERFGAFRAATDLLGYLWLFDLGIGGALCALLVPAIQRSEPRELGAVIAIGIRAYLKVLAVMTLGGIGLGLLVSRIVSVEGVIATELQIGFCVNLLCLLLIPLNVFQLLMDAEQRGYFKNIALLIQSVLTSGGLLWFAWLGFGIPGQFFAILLGNFCFSALITWKSLQRYPSLIPLILRPPQEHAPSIQQRLWQLNTPGLIFHLAARIGLLSDNLFISFFLGPAAVVPFLITQRLAILAQTQLESVTVATWAALADLKAQGDDQTFNARLVDLTRLLMVMGLTIVIPILAYNIHFVALWVGVERFAGWAVTALMAWNITIRGVFHLWKWCFIGTGLANRLVKLSIVDTIVNVGVSLVATQRFGLVGPLLGTFVSGVGLYSWWMPRLLKQNFGTQPVQLYAVIARPLFVGIPYSAIAIWISTHHTPLGWIGLAIEMLITAGLYLVAAWYLVFSLHDRLIWRQRLLGFLPKRKIKQTIP
ncbi:lipopolysaccharide biosynthesis protein [Leptolyngbya sp. AN03gr2]|uniref:lipopolysaccharide biosynthesis protein n=1 Tax=unclassified Leptolyngbya TaxID=2650499 RepID=UPI003D3153A8